MKHGSHGWTGTQMPTTKPLYMDAREYLGIESTDNPVRWRVPIRLPICGGSGYLHGGCALGIAVQVAEDGLDRPVAWTSAQFISRAGPGDVIDVTVDPLATGNRMSQAQVRVVVTAARL